LLRGYRKLLPGQGNQHQSGRGEVDSPSVVMSPFCNPFFRSLFFLENNLSDVFWGRIFEV